MSQQQVFSDRYELVRHVARGGMAQVYLAKDLLLDRPVALKVLFPELSVDQSFVERFRREAQAAANLSHPNIVSIYDWGQGDNTYFIVMEYIDGHTLSSLIRQGPIDASRAAAIGADVASALDFAHRHNVIHRDVKPGNVLIDKSGQVKVTDFGIARAIGAKEGLTQTGAVMGTATYFSPEQAQGYSVDARSDVYSLGVVLYEMVVGKPPFEGDNPVAIAYKHVREEPVLPSVANPAVPKAFEAIVMQAMAKETDDRYQTADALRADLLRFHLGQGVLAPEVTPTMVAATGVMPRTRGVRDVSTVVADGRPDLVEEDARRSRTALFALLLVLLLAVLAVLVFFLGRELGLWGGTNVATLTVPSDLIGQPYPTAQAELTRDGFTDVVKATQPSKLPIDQVLLATPAGGTKLKANQKLTLTVSPGPAQVGVPSEVGTMQAQATADLTSKGFTPQIASQPSPTVPAGVVISQTPLAGSTAAQGSTVTLTVSTGPQTVAVPSVAGDDPVTAGRTLSAAGLTPKQTNETSSSVPAGTVISTNPPAGTSVAPNSTVVVYVSTGPKQVTVPNIDGESVGQAVAQLSAVGLKYTQTNQAVATQAQNGTVISSSPGQGSTAPQGSTVALIVGTYTAPTTTTTVPPPTTTTCPAPPPSVPGASSTTSTSTCAST